MQNAVFEKVEAIIGKVSDFVLLDEQGCTSEVSRIVTEERSYILKSANKEKYRLWLKDETSNFRKASR